MQSTLGAATSGAAPGLVCRPGLIAAPWSASLLSKGPAWQAGGGPRARLRERNTWGDSLNARSASASAQWCPPLRHRCSPRRKSRR